MTKRNKILLSLIPLSGLIAFPPVIWHIVATAKTHKASPKKYELFNNAFNSKEEAMAFANAQTKRSSQNTRSPIAWTIKDNNQTLKFREFNDLSSYVSNKIQTQSYSSYKQNFSTNLDGSLISSELLNMNFQDVNKIEIYRGKDNSIHLSEQTAKDSYLQIHEAYFYDNLFFRTKEELAVYLEKLFSDPNNLNVPKLESIVLKDSNGNLSLPIKVKDIKNNLANKGSSVYQYISNFVDNSYKPYFEYEDQYYSEKNLQKINSIYEPKFTEINSNQGKGNYIIDTDKSDQAQLFGPYYVKSDADINKISDKTKWTRIEGTNHSIIDDYKEVSLISNFMNIIMTDIPNTEAMNPFIQVHGDLQKEIDAYFLELETNLPKIYNSLLNISNKMKKGKRNGEFLRLPIFFLHTMDQIINYKESQKYIDNTREIYSKICKYYDSLIYKIVPEAFLYNKYNEKFSLLELIGIQNQKLDLNYDISYLTSKISHEYYDFYEFMNFFIKAQMMTSKVTSNEKMEFSFDMFQGDGFIPLNQKFLDQYKLVWNTLNSSNIDELYENMSAINIINQTDPARIYMDNFSRQQIANESNKLLINYWLDKEHTIKNYDLKQDSITWLDGITSENNDVFKIENNAFYSINKQTLYDLYVKLDKDIQPVLFSKLIFLMNSGVNVNSLLKGINWNSRSTITRQIIIEKSMNYVNAKFKSTFFGYGINKLSGTHLGALSQESLSLSSIFRSNKITITETIKPTKPNMKEEYSKQAFSIYSTTIGTIKTCVDLIQGNFQGDPAVAIAMGVASILRDVSNLVAIAFPWMAGFAIVFDMLASLYKKDFFSYKFETKDVKYIWNGGSQESWFYGMIPGKAVTAEDMKLLDPLEIIRPNTKNGYYYNGVSYETEDALKNIQLKDILNNRYQNNNLNKVYSIADIENNQVSDNHLIANSLIELKENFVQYLTNSVNDPEKYQKIIDDKNLVIKPSQYKYGSAEYDNNLTLIANVNKIINNIKPTFLAQTPILSTQTQYLNMPHYENHGNDDKSIKPYKLPYHSYSVSGGTSYNDDKNFIIVDGNQDKETLSIPELKNSLKEKFYKSFDVHSKTIDSQFLYTNNLYSESSSSIIYNNVYIVSNNNLEQKVFLNKIDAFNWLLKELNLTTHYNEEKLDVIYFQDKVFYSHNDYINWINHQIKEIE